MEKKYKYFSFDEDINAEDIFDLMLCADLMREESKYSKEEKEELYQIYIDLLKKESK